MRIAICDDVKQEQERLVKVLREADPAHEIECFLRGKDLLVAVAKAPPFDVAFLDIYMPEENGVKIAQRLKELSPTTGIVFVTVSMDHAVDAFSLHALHYLIKPVTFEGVVKSLRRLMESKNKRSPVILIPSGNQSITVSLDEISYVQSNGHFKEIVLNGGKAFSVHMTMEELESKLGKTFLKLNRSVFVNMDQIEWMGADACLLKNGIRLDFARRERVNIRTAYDNYLFLRLNERKEGRR